MVLGIDPGTRKCGYAVIERCGAPPLELGVVPLDDLARRFDELRAAYPFDLVAVGRGTNAAAITAVVTRAGLPFVLVDEYETSLHARARFFDDHPPRGWKRLVPRGMLLPDRPIDDYAALLIAERYLESAG